MLPIVDDCDDCVPAYARRSSGLAGAFSTLPFVLTFVAVTVLVLTKVYPRLWRPFRPERTAQHGTRSRHWPDADATQSENVQAVAKNLPAVTFSCTVALSVVLIELLLCEISNSFDPAARGFALRLTVTSLLASLVVAIPLIEIQSILSSLGWKFADTTKGRKRTAWLLELVGYTIFLICFWTLGQLLPYASATKTAAEGFRRQGMVQAALERLGVAGISSMALLSGFASVSSIWHNLVNR